MSEIFSCPLMYHVKHRQKPTNVARCAIEQLELTQHFGQRRNNLEDEIISHHDTVVTVQLPHKFGQ